MPSYLTFALVAPMASFGGIAVGERRLGWDRPARSAVLGLMAACLGLERDDDAAQEALATGYALALLCHSSGLLVADYHTTQVPRARRDRRFATRAEELAVPKEDLSTVLSQREYRSGAWHLSAIWPLREPVRWSLSELTEAMRRPVFVPYLGRKSCPLGLPLYPDIIEAPDAPAALLSRHCSGPEASLKGTNGRPLRDVLANPTGDTMVVMDASEVTPDDKRHRRTEFRRDQPRSRRRWQFDLREEAVLSARWS